METRSLIRAHGSAIWPGWSDDALSALVLTPDGEYLFCRQPQQGFAPAPRDAVTGCRVQVRQLENNLDDAAIVELGDEAVAMIGTPEGLEYGGIDWQLTLAHEMFHAFQNSLPGYLAAVDAVSAQLRPEGTADASWMLTHPFPYDEPETAELLAPMAGAAVAYLESTDADVRRAAILRYLAARREAELRLGARHWLYYEFQAGQEGVARWTERALAVEAGAVNRDYAQAAEERRLGMLNSIRAIERQGIGIWKRNTFYAYGSVEADMLDFLDPHWRAAYEARPFTLGEHLAERLNPSGNLR
ncbi:hypothetical protein [Aurantiacibacter sp. MUD61]|uniref:hypothetical protein n=1 Tax=Aurantiacibacter sp. MUD61 TaxID=3009083 RepID=UPI0022F0C243|nr:hypothetical protein [Aurantiacibacter sp. MUD61]